MSKITSIPSYWISRIFQTSTYDLDLITCNDLGNVTTRTTFARNYGKIIQNAEIKKIKFHDIRHTHATLLLKQGVHPKVVSEHLGHTDISMTLRMYSHVLPNMQEDAVKIFAKSIF
ncbi:hypothetical protein AWW70_25645 [Bacillus mycoides]|uniref:Tyr recombinase domain-containing protein n=1 Tax=Bacillus mycoides TaxID=1405 RepID=A0A109FUZ8_BACMY|nr:hypothetical protein AWW70_25645 [Bacillus mycoides]